MSIFWSYIFLVKLLKVKEIFVRVYFKYILCIIYYGHIRFYFIWYNVCWFENSTTNKNVQEKNIKTNYNIFKLICIKKYVNIHYCFVIEVRMIDKQLYIFFFFCLLLFILIYKLIYNCVLLQGNDIIRQYLKQMANYFE